MPDPTTVATVNHPRSPARPPRRSQIANLPIRQSEKAYLRAVIECGTEATVADLAAEIGCTPRTVKRMRRRLEANPAIRAAGFRVEERFRRGRQISSSIVLPRGVDR